MFCLNKKVVENLAQLKKKLNALGQSFELQKRAHNFYAQPNKALPRKAWKSHSKKKVRQTCPGEKSLLAARKYAGDPYKEKMDVNANKVSGSRNIFKQKKAISAPERCALTNKVKAERE